MKIVIGHHARDQVLFAGPFGVGKTTALRTVSTIQTTDTDVTSLEARALGLDGKNATTVGFDYGECTTAEGTPISLIGVPGQDRFEAMWDILMPRSSAVVLWVYGDRSPELGGVRSWLDTIALRQSVTRLALGVTRVLSSDPSVLEPFRALAAEYHPLATVTAADPRLAGDVTQLLEATLRAPLAAMERKRHDAL